MSRPLFDGSLWCPFSSSTKWLEDVSPTVCDHFVLPVISSCSVWSLTRKDKAEDDGVGGNSV